MPERARDVPASLQPREGKDAGADADGRGPTEQSRERVRRKRSGRLEDRAQGRRAKPARGNQTDGPLVPGRPSPVLERPFFAAPLQLLVEPQGDVVRAEPALGDATRLVEQHPDRRDRRAQHEGRPPVERVGRGTDEAGCQAQHPEVKDREPAAELLVAADEHTQHDGHLRAPLEREAELLGEILTFLRAVGRILGEAALDRMHELARGPVRGRGERGRAVRHLPGEDLGRLFRLERQAPREREIPHDAEGVQIAAPVHALAQRLLGAHELRRADDLAAVQPRRAGDQSRDPEVGDEGAARRRLEHDVVGLHVAVDHPLRVCVGERPRHFTQHPRRLGRREGSAGAHAIGQRFAFNVRHREEHELPHLVHGKDRHDVGMRQLRRRARLPQEPLPQRRVPRLGGREQLDRDRPIEPHLPRQVHDPHAATPQLALERVAPGHGGLEREEEGIGGGAEAAIEELC